MNYSLRMKRLLVGSAAGAMVLATVPTGIAAADAAAVCEDAPENDFDDVAESNSHKTNIDCLAAYSITVGDSDGDYNPGDPVTRGQMATFIARFITQAESGSLDIPTDAEDAFSDDDGTTHENAINYLASLEVVAGTGGDNYSPGATVTRGQMARFIVNALEHLGFDVPEDAEDHFDDDDGTTHEDMINILAELQVVSGFNDDTYRPGEGVSRQQMATFIIGAAGAADDQDLWNGDMDAEVTPPAEANQTFTVTPSTATQLTVANEAGATPTSDDRQYTVTGLEADTQYAIILFDGDEVEVAENGHVTFNDDAENAGAGNNLADEGAVDALVTVVNGTPVGGGGAREATAQPVNGQITFTVDGVSHETVVPVVVEDEDNDQNVDLDADNEPTEDFGVGGLIDYLPGEFATSEFDFTDGADDLAEANDGEITRVEDGFFVARNDAAGVGAEFVFEFDANDRFFIDSDGPTGAGFTAADVDEQVTMEEFVAELSVGDNILGTVYQRTEGFQSTFLLYDDSPAAPTLTVGTETATTIPISIDDFVEGAEIQVFLAEGAGLDYNADTTGFQLVATLTEDDDTNTNDDDIDYTITVAGDATGAQNWTVAARQIVNGESSAADNENATTPILTETVRPTITNTERTVDGGVAGVLIAANGDSGDTIQIDFSEPMSGTLGDDATTFFRVSDGTNTFQVTCSANVDNDANDDCVLGNGPGSTGADDQLLVRLGDADITITRIAGEGPLDPVSATVSVTFVSNAFADANGNLLDLANSSDVVVDDEA